MVGICFSSVHPDIGTYMPMSRTASLSASGIKVWEKLNRLWAWGGGEQLCELLLNGALCSDTYWIDSTHIIDIYSAS